MKIYLEDNYLNLVRSILKEQNVNGDIYVFGSRTRGDHGKYSDLDLLFKQDSSIELKKLLKLKELFEKSKLPITVDIVDWHKISNEFRDKIKSELVKL